MTEKHFFPDCYFYEKEDGVYFFSGLIASSRMLSFGDDKNIVCSICVSSGKYIELLTKTKQHDFSNLYVRVKHPSQEKKDNWDKSKSKHGKTIDVICKQKEVTVWGRDKNGLVIELPDHTAIGGARQKRHIKVTFLDEKTSKKSII